MVRRMRYGTGSGCDSWDNRSGNRSKQASRKLAALGYTNVCKFGGISGWPYDIE
jgi:hypothetical protein